MASDGVKEILLGLLLTAIGFGSIISRAPIICCGFAIFGPILFIVGVVKALQSPSVPPMYYPPSSMIPPYAPAPAVPPASPPSSAHVGSKTCSMCGSENRLDAKFCTSCGTPF